MRRTKQVGPFALIELENVPWDFWQRIRGDLIVLCGELGHAEWCLYQIAWKFTVEQIFAASPVELARRVGVELDSTRATNPSEPQRSGA